MLNRFLIRSACPALSKVARAPAADKGYDADE